MYAEIAVILRGENDDFFGKGGGGGLARSDNVQKKTVFLIWLLPLGPH